MLVGANFSRKYSRQFPANWTAIAKNVRIPFDDARQLHREFAQWDDSMKCKQADTIMLSCKQSRHTGPWSFQPTLPGPVTRAWV